MSNLEVIVLEAVNYLVFLKFAVKVLLLSIVTINGLLVLVMLPVHLKKTNFGLGVAINVTCVLGVYRVPQFGAGEIETVPLPLGLTPTVKL